MPVEQTENPELRQKLLELARERKIGSNFNLIECVQEMMKLAGSEPWTLWGAFETAFRDFLNGYAYQTLHALWEVIYKDKQRPDSLDDIDPVFVKYLEIAGLYVSRGLLLSLGYCYNDINRFLNKKSIRFLW